MNLLKHKTLFQLLAPNKIVAPKPNEGTSNQVMMSTGASSDQYQTVTIVPSDGDTGEVIRYTLQSMYSNNILTFI